MAPFNKMNKLLDKLERRLGTAPLNLPKELNKEAWADQVISNETLDTFSRYFPNAIIINLDKSMRRKDGYYVLDKYLDDGVEILGVKDVDWGTFSYDSVTQQAATGFGLYSVLPSDYSLSDVATLQSRADVTSLYNNQIYVDFKPPNMVKLVSSFRNDVTLGSRTYPITIFIKHANNLMTIPPTQMEIFEELAEADVARFLYENLKHYDGLETAYTNIDIKVGELENKAGKREDIVQRLDEAHTTFSNKNQPMIWCV